jgi:hypothetical protein
LGWQRTSKANSGAVTANPGVAIPSHHPQRRPVKAKPAKKAKSAPAAAKSSLVVAPPPPKTRVVTARSPRKAQSTKRPLDAREYPAARDSRGKASRAEIRREGTRIAAPRASNRTAERGNQSRSHKRATRGTK